MGCGQVCKGMRAAQAQTQIQLECEEISGLGTTRAKLEEELSTSVFHSLVLIPLLLCTQLPSPGSF